MLATLFIASTLKKETTGSSDATSNTA
jgi:hypothetical protein